MVQSQSHTFVNEGNPPLRVPVNVCVCTQMGLKFLRQGAFCPTRILCAFVSSAARICSHAATMTLSSEEPSDCVHVCAFMRPHGCVCQWFCRPPFYATQSLYLSRTIRDGSLKAQPQTYFTIQVSGMASVHAIFNPDLSVRSKLLHLLAHWLTSVALYTEPGQCRPLAPLTSEAKWGWGRHFSCVDGMWFVSFCSNITFSIILDTWWW